MLKAYHCWHYLCRETCRCILATDAFTARRELARDMGVHVTDIIARRA